MSNKTLVIMGTGGIGKTTLAASLGVCYADRGEKVLVLTIDPSKRLKTSLGISIEETWSAVPDYAGPGQLFGATVNTEQIFDEFIRQSFQSSGSSTAEKLLKNKLYQQLKTTLGGSQEFTSLEALLRAHRAGIFDRVILDTPPAQNSIEFLDSPEELSALFDEGVLKWFRSSDQGAATVIGKILRFSTAQAVKVLELMTGSQFMSELTDFFDAVSSSREKLKKRADDAAALLRDSGTHFILASGPAAEKVRETCHWAQELKKRGLKLTGVWINRASPAWTETPASKTSAEEKIWRDYYLQRTTELQGLVKSLAVPLVVLPELDEDISDFSGIQKFAKVIAAKGSL